jgi:putative DNA primase/helicase
MTDFHSRTTDAAKGKWRGILLELGVPSSFLNGKHGPCPLCDGKDRFRFDNKEGKGTYICSQCGAGDGMSLAIKYTGKEFREVASEIDRILGNKKFSPDQIKREISDESRIRYLRKVASMCQRIEPGSVADTYLKSRGLGDTQYPKALRLIPSLNDGEGGTRPCLIGIVQAPDGSNATLHRTYLEHNGSGKAEAMLSPRKIMPGSVPDGSAIRLSDWVPGPIGIAEGIETALAASILFEIPVWAAINSTMLEKWIPPEGAEDITIFGDNDAAFGGQASAYRLAHNLAVKKHDVCVKIPDIIGQDWNDVLLAKCAKRQRKAA